AYDGSVYTPARGYGWLTDLREHGWDGGGTGNMILPDGTRASPLAVGRLELANWQGTHQENRPQVFRIDLPDGWYRVTCTSVDPDNSPLPLVDERSIKFRAHDVVIAGSRYGVPLKVEGNRLVEGSAVVEVTEGHLRIVVGDVAYGGWVWGYSGPFFQGWRAWWRLGRKYAANWYQVLTRTVDPGFHSLRFNSLEIERVPRPARHASLVFRDYMNRDDHLDINAGLPAHARWVPSPFTASSPTIQHDLFHTSIRLIGPPRGQGSLALTQRAQSPATGNIRYATRVSLFTGEGSHIHRGSQEAGLLILADPAEPTDASSTFVGIAFEAGHPETRGWMKLRVGDGMDGFRAKLEIPDTLLPFRITEGEYEIIVEHAVAENRITRVCVNGADVTDLIPPARRTPPHAQGAFGIRARMDARDSGVRLQQFYWYYRVEEVSNAQDNTPSERVSLGLPPARSC
ncbi:MAG: hypothetical protein ACREOH_05485, partial [Candidatus Entotheonellia bacterium]